MVVPLSSRPEGHDRSVRLNDGSFRMVGVVSRVKVMAVNGIGDNGLPWRGGTRNDKTRPWW